MNTFTDRIKTISWKFRDAQEAYPEIKDTSSIEITDEKVFYEKFNGLFDKEVAEKFMVFWLNTTNRVIGFELVSQGTLSTTCAHAREIFRGAIVASCQSIILAHNHPSGYPKPSEEDIGLTRQLIKAGKILGIDLQDHIIFGQPKNGSDPFTSIRRENPYIFDSLY